MSREPTPEESGIYEQSMEAVAQILYSDETHSKVMTILQSGAQDPSKALASAASIILLQLKERSKGQLTPEILQGVLKELMMLLGELATESGAFEVNQDVMMRALQQCMSVVGTQQGEEAPAQPQGQPQAQAQAPMPEGQGGLISGAMG